MDNSVIDKEAIRYQSREATIKHYVLGCILECAINNNSNVITKIMDFLVYDLKIMTDENFITFWLRVRVNRLALMSATKRNYRMLKNNLEIISYTKEKQIDVLRKLQRFVKNYENGIFVNSKIGQSSFCDIDYYL